MGVIKRTQRNAIDASISENEVIGEIVIAIQQEDDGGAESQDDGGSDIMNFRRQSLYNPNPRRRTLRTRLPAIPVDTTPRRNNAYGSRKIRRYENTLVLLRESGRDETDHDEVSIEDLVPVIQASRTFSRFLCEASMMGLWNTFVECQDESNGKIRQSRSLLKTHGHGPKSTDPEHAFRGICRKLRNILKQRHLPLGIVDNLEEQVLEFFQTHPLTSTYECGPLDAYRRGLLHAISQYNNLKSFSIGNKKTEKIVHVQNKQSGFLPPSLSLVSYIETRLQMEPKN